MMGKLSTEQVIVFDNPLIFEMSNVARDHQPRGKNDHHQPSKIKYFKYHCNVIHILKMYRDVM